MFLLGFPGMSNLCKEGGDGYRWPCYDATWEFSKDILYLQVDFNYALVLDCVVACFGSDLVPAHHVCKVWLHNVWFYIYAWFKCWYCKYRVWFSGYNPILLFLLIILTASLVYLYLKRGIWAFRYNLAFFNFSLHRSESPPSGGALRCSWSGFPTMTSIMIHLLDISNLLWFQCFQTGIKDKLTVGTCLLESVLFQNLSTCLLTVHQPSSAPRVHCRYKSAPYLRFLVTVRLICRLRKNQLSFVGFVSLFLVMSISFIKALGLPSHVSDAWS